MWHVWDAIEIAHGLAVPLQSDALMNFGLCTKFMIKKLRKLLPISFTRIWGLP